MNPELTRMVAIFWIARKPEWPTARTWSNVAGRLPREDFRRRSGFFSREWETDRTGGFDRVFLLLALK
jgi:hypothetical protein